MVLAANTLMGNRFQGLKSYTDGVHRNEEKNKKSEKTEKDSGFSPKTKKVKILDKTKNVNVEENTENDIIKGDGDGEDGDSNKDKKKGNDNRNNNRNKNKNKNVDNKIINSANSSSSPSSLSLPIESIDEKTVLNRATASDRIKQIKLLVLLKIIKKFEVKFYSLFFFFIKKIFINTVYFYIFYSDLFDLLFLSKVYIKTYVCMYV